MLLSSLVLLVLSPLSGAAPPTYWGEVRAALRKSCTVCHNRRNLDEVEISGGLTLDTYQAVLKWKTKDLVKPGKSQDSLLFQVVVTDDTEKRMPLGAKPLPPETIDLLQRWIDAGAPEGIRPADTPAPLVTGPTKTRKRDVSLATSLMATPQVFKGVKRGPLQLNLKVGPLAPVVALAFSPDGKSLAVGTYGQVAIWDLAEPAPKKVLTNVLGAVNDLRFSPDGSLLAVAGGQPSAKGDLRLFEVASWKLKTVLAGHDDTVVSVAFRADGKKLASASYDKTVRTWDVASGKQEKVFTHHSDFVHGVSWMPDGKSLLSVSKDRSARLFEVETGASKFTFSDRQQDALCLAVSPDGKSLIVSGLEPALTWWNTETGARVRSSPGHRLGVHELAFNKTGTILASAGADGTVKLWSSAGTATRTLSVGSMVYSVAVSPDGKWVASGSFDGLVRLFDTSNGRPLATLLTLPLREGRPMTGTSSSPDWLALTPQGYATGSQNLLSEGRWSVGTTTVPAEVVWKTLRNPTAVARSLRREVVPEPTFGK